MRNMELLKEIASKMAARDVCGSRVGSVECAGCAFHLTPHAYDPVTSPRCLVTVVLEAKHNHECMRCGGELSVNCITTGTKVCVPCLLTEGKKIAGVQV